MELEAGVSMRDTGLSHFAQLQCLQIAERVAYSQP